jgi:S1-C subfamily serine protease
MSLRKFGRKLRKILKLRNALELVILRLPYNIKIPERFVKYFRRPLKIILIVVFCLIGFWAFLMMFGFGLARTSDFISSIYWSSYVCGPKNISDAAEGVVKITMDDGSSGSGFWVAQDLVMTNNHVISFENNINVIDDTGTAYSAEVVQTDTIRDLAILKVSNPDHPGENHKIIPWRSGWPVLAENVYTLGFPEDTKDITTTKGIVSALTHDPVDDEQYIQTDAPINPGNSGGPLVDVCGRLVGINASTLKDAENIGYAIETVRIKDKIDGMIAAAKNITPDLIANGQTGDQDEVVAKYYDTLSQGDFDTAYGFYSKNLKSHVLFKGWEDSYKDTFVIRLKMATNPFPNVVDVTFIAIDNPNGDYGVKEFEGSWTLVKEDGLWKLDQSHITEVPLESPN